MALEWWVLLIEQTDWMQCLFDSPRRVDSNRKCFTGSHWPRLFGAIVVAPLPFGVRSRENCEGAFGETFFVSSLVALEV